MDLDTIKGYGGANMTLRQKTVLIISITLIIMIGILYVTSRSLLLKNFTDEEKQDTTNDVLQVEEVLNNEISSLSEKGIDWSAWDDTYRFIDDLNQEYIKVNLVDSTLSGLRLNMMAFFNIEGKMVMAKGFDLHDSRETPVSPSFKKFIAVNSFMIKHSSPQSSHSGIVLLDEGPMMIVSQPIVTSTRQGPVRGALVIGRYLDAAEIERVSKIAHLLVNVYRVGDSGNPPDVKTVENELTGRGKVMIRPLDSDTVAGYTELEDVKGRQALVLRVAGPRDIYRHGQASVKYYVIFLVVSGLVIGMIILLLLERILLSRLSGLSKDIGRIGTGGDLSARVSVSGHDELAMVATSVNGMLAALEQAQNDLFENMALRHSEEHYRTLVEMSPDAVFIISSGQCVFANAAGAELLGMGNASKLAGVPAAEVIIPGNGADALVWLEQLIAHHDVKRAEEKLIRPDGTVIDIQVAAMPFIYQGNDAVQLVAQDITRRKRVENELMEKDRRIGRELHLASAIQSSLFPTKLPCLKGVAMAATAVSANEVGGDYCDLFVTKDSRLGIAIGDVMGKGVPAALFGAMTYAFVRQFALEMDSPCALVNRVNRMLFPQLDMTQQFITFLYAVYDPSTRELTYTNAGHNPPLVYRASGGFCEILEIRDYFIGGLPESSYREGKTILCPGDVVLFYTDGLKECRNRSGEPFGSERIKHLLTENNPYDPASIQEIISEQFIDFLDGQQPSDDMTMIVIKIDA